MGFQQRLVYFAIHTSLVISVLPFVRSSQEHSKPMEILTMNEANTHKLSPKLSFQIKLHGFLLWASMGFLMPIGILIIRMSNREKCARRIQILFYFHAISQMLAVFLATAGAVNSIKYFNNSFNNIHQRIGVALYGLIWLQALIGFFRPQRGSKGRSVWFSIHWVIGTSVSVLGIIDIYTGLQAFHEKSSRSTRLWTILFTAELALIGFLYLFQDKWVSIQKQRVILGNELIRPTNQQVSPKDNPKEYFEVP